MLKKNYICLIFYLFIIINFNIFAQSEHIQTLQSKFPYSLLGDDFEILNEKDMAINTCEASPAPFSEKFSESPYWQCFETKNAKLFCDGHGYDEDEKDFLTVLVIAGKREGRYHEYITRRAIYYSVCQDFLKDWQRFTKNEKHVCVSGPFTSNEIKKNGQAYSLWIFDKFKTKKGCMPYFVGGCSLKYRLKNGCKLGF